MPGASLPPPIANLLADPDNTLKGFIADPVTASLGENCLHINPSKIAENLALSRWNDKELGGEELGQRFRELFRGENGPEYPNLRLATTSVCHEAALGLLRRGYNVAIVTDLKSIESQSIFGLIQEAPGSVEVMGVLRNQMLQQGLTLEKVFENNVPGQDPTSDLLRMRSVTHKKEPGLANEVGYFFYNAARLNCEEPKTQLTITVVDAFGHNSRPDLMASVGVAVENLQRIVGPTRKYSSLDPDESRASNKIQIDIAKALAPIEKHPLPDPIVEALRPSGKGLLYQALTGHLPNTNKAIEVQSSFRELCQSLASSRPNTPRRLFNPNNGLAELQQAAPLTTVCETSHHLAFKSNDPGNQDIVMAKKSDLIDLGLALPQLGKPLTLPREPNQPDRERGRSR